MHPSDIAYAVTVLVNNEEKRRAMYEKDKKKKQTEAAEEAEEAEAELAQPGRGGRKMKAGNGKTASKRRKSVKMTVQGIRGGTRNQRQRHDGL